MSIKSIKNSKEYRSFIKKLYNKKDKNAVSGIYKITSSLDNNMFYIGSATDINKRWICHKYDLEHKCHGNYRMQKDYDKYGLDIFVFEVIWKSETIISRVGLYKVEQEYIDNLKPTYNIQLSVVIPPIKNKQKRAKKKKVIFTGPKMVRRLKEGVTGKDLNGRNNYSKNKKKIRRERDKKKVKVRLSDHDRLKLAKRKWKSKSGKRSSLFKYKN